MVDGGGRERSVFKDFGHYLLYVVIMSVFRIARMRKVKYIANYERKV